MPSDKPRTLKQKQPSGSVKMFRWGHTQGQIEALRWVLEWMPLSFRTQDVATKIKSRLAALEQGKGEE